MNKKGKKQKQKQKLRNPLKRCGFLRKGKEKESQKLSPYRAQVRPAEKMRVSPT